MKVTQFGPGGLPLALAGWSTGVVSVNSNFHTNDGGFSATNFVQGITANGSNMLSRPIANIAAGSNILLTIDAGPGNSIPSNTVRIHSTGAFSGNLITSNGSNSLAAVVNLVAGSGIALGVSGQNITITNTGSGGGAGGGGFSTSYLGYDTIGGNTESMTVNRIYCKKITAGASGNTLLGMAAYVDQTSEAVVLFLWALFADNAGVIGDLITPHYTASVALAHGTGGGVSFPARWLHVPMTYPLAASTSYWVGILANVTSGGPRLYYDTSGSDRYMPMGSTPYISDGGYTGVGTQTDSTRRYSIRALVI